MKAPGTLRFPPLRTRLREGGLPDPLLNPPPFPLIGSAFKPGGSIRGENLRPVAAARRKASGVLQQNKISGYVQPYAAKQALPEAALGAVTPRAL